MPNEDRERALPDLWAKAADVLKSDPDPEKRSLIEQYSATLKEEIGPSKMDDCATPFLGLQPGQAAKLLNAKAEELKNLACAGVIVILTFLIRQIEQREQLFKGLDLVSSIICRYLVMETVFRPRIQVDSVSKATARDLERDFENNLVNLYAKILEFQARALSYVQRSRPSQFFRDTFRGDTWKTLMADIKDLDGQCRAFADLVTDEKLHSFLDNQLQPSTHSEPKAYAEIVESEQLQRQRAEWENDVHICCLIDALDECEESDRRKLISALDKFYMNPDDRQHLKVIVTSRPEMMIQRQFRRLEKSWPKIHLRGEDDEQLAKISQEIDVFARSRTQCITESIPLEPLETQFLQQEISKTKNRTYLWVKMVLDVIENVLAFTTDKAAEILAGLPKGLDMLYEKILNRCQDIEKARNVLQIVIAAVRPLTLEEMAVALAMSTNEHLSSRIKLEPPGRFRETLRAICGLFVTIIDDKIYFIHQTAKEFLARDLADSNVPRLIRTPNESSSPKHACVIWVHAWEAWQCKASRSAKWSLILTMSSSNILPSFGRHMF
ncbi:hypothetical protein K4K60_004118 [Colletotrichum sp. SAR11_57]|nr:hypothetical protein K4K60_004118 [Colletotrichum sp. SAR11_57]